MPGNWIPVRFHLTPAITPCGGGHASESQSQPTRLVQRLLRRRLSEVRQSQPNPDGAHDCPFRLPFFFATAAFSAFDEPSIVSTADRSTCATPGGGAGSLRGRPRPVAGRSAAGMVKAVQSTPRATQIAITSGHAGSCSPRSIFDTVIRWQLARSASSAWLSPFSSRSSAKGQSGRMGLKP